MKSLRKIFQRKNRRWSVEELSELMNGVALRVVKEFDEANPYKKTLNINHAEVVGLVKQAMAFGLRQNDVLFLQVAENPRGSRLKQLKEFTQGLAGFLKPIGVRVALIPHDVTLGMAEAIERKGATAEAPTAPVPLTIGEKDELGAMAEKIPNHEAFDQPQV